MAIVLLVTHKDEQTIELPILSKCTLGRSSNCDLVIKDTQMSGKHGFFEVNTNGQLFYTDLGSTNGSFLNSSQIQKIQFKLSETLRLGNTTITIDESKLNSRERLSVGRGLQEDNERTLILPSDQTQSTVYNIEKDAKDEQQSKAPPKERVAGKVVLLNKSIKAKNNKSTWMGSKKENIIAQEKSTGETKMLKLDDAEKKKNKK
jgi:pSer/pThr/pTyr-binding forkhead associated (FHA) protein